MIESNGYSWFQDLLTLDHPYVPSIPTAEWFNTHILQDALRLSNTPNHIVVYEDRVQQARLFTRFFDEISMANQVILVEEEPMYIDHDLEHFLKVLRFRILSTQKTTHSPFAIYIPMIDSDSQTNDIESYALESSEQDVELEVPLVINASKLTTSIEETDEMLEESVERRLSLLMLASHLVTRLGDKMWDFIVPLILIFISPSSLVPTSLYGLSTTLIRIILGASVGDFVDKKKKLLVIQVGVFGQAISIGLSCLALYSLVSNSDRELLEADIFYSSTSTSLFIFILLMSALHSLSSQIMDISVERKWVPAIIKRDSLLTLTNTRMRQIDLATEVVAPFIAGTLASSRDHSIRAFIVVGLINFVSFFPQYVLLTEVYHTTTAQRFHIDAPEQPLQLAASFDLLGEWNPLANIIRGWSLFAQQKVFLVVIAYVLLWVTLLSPHDPVLTAYLSSTGNFTYLELSTFRGVGAIFGLISTLSFNFIVRRIGVINASAAYILEEGVMIVAAALAFTGLEINSTKIAFLVFIVCSRMGLYGFEVCEIHFVQRGVPDNIRGIVSGVESSLTSLASLLVFVFCLLYSRPDQFYILVWISVTFITSGVLTLLYWIRTNKDIPSSFYSIPTHDS
eukprot:gene12387-14533_t